MAKLGLTTKVDGLEQSRAAFFAITPKFQENINNHHSGMITALAKRAEKNFQESIRKPDPETGAREHARQTGNFTFGRRAGTRGAGGGGEGAFKGVIVNDPSKHVYGFGYPDVHHADLKTHYVWRTLEFGLSGAKVTQRSHPFAPRGQAKFPTKFTFLPFGGKRGILYPQKSGSAPSGLLVSPQGRIYRSVPHPGIKPKLFITRAIDSLLSEVIDGYQKVLAQTFDDLR